MRNDRVTHYVTDPVTVPRPDPTRPDPSNRAELSIHDLRRGSAELMDGRFAAMLGGWS